MIKVVAFDLDGMVLKKREYFSTRMQKKINIPEKELMNFFQGELKECQRGKLDMKKILENKYFSAWGWVDGFNAFIKWWFSGEVIDLEIIKLIKRNRKLNIKNALLTNNEKYRLKFIVDKFNLDELFDFIIPSYEAGSIKPEKEYFNKLLEVTSMLAKEILICDDKGSRLTGANQLGFKICLYKGINEFGHQLKNNLSKI